MGFIIICLTIVVVILVIDDIIWKKKYDCAVQRADTLLMEQKSKDNKIRELEITLQERGDDIRRLSKSLGEYADKLGKACLERDEAKIGEKRAKEQASACTKDIFIQKTELLEQGEKLAKTQEQLLLANQKLASAVQGKRCAEEKLPRHCSFCGKFLVKDSSLHIQTANGVVCKSCFEKLQYNKEV